MVSGAGRVKAVIVLSQGKRGMAGMFSPRGVTAGTGGERAYSMPLLPQMRIFSATTSFIASLPGTMYLRGSLASGCCEK